MIDCPVRNPCQKFVNSFVINKCHEKYDTIDDGKNDRDCKSRLVFIQLKISTCPRNVHEQKVSMKEGFVCHVNSYFCFPKIELKLRSFGILLVDNLSFSKYFNAYRPFHNGTFQHESFQHGYFITGTFRHMHCSVLRTFRQMDFSTSECFIQHGEFWNGKFLTRGIFET